jgi:predicted DNA-binding transcriptional regulator AlpA
MSNNTDLLTIPEAAPALGRSGPTIRRYIAQGYLPVV